MTNALECPSCGAPLEMREGDSVTIYGSVTVDHSGRIVDEEARGGWCPECRRRWEAKAG